MLKTVLISGGSEGLGFAIAKKLITDYKVYILSPVEEELINAAKEIGCEYKVCDVTDYSRVEQICKEIIEESGSIDVCINNAGIWIEGELENNDPDMINKVLEVNTLGTIYLAKSVTKYMKSQKSGTILNVISQAGLNAKSNRSVYYASKWAITGFTKCLYHELAPFNIKVIGFYPGKMNTKMFLKAGSNQDVSKTLDPCDVAETVKFIISSKSNVIIPEIGICSTEF